MNLEQLRDQFPASLHTVNLNHAGVSPLSIRCAAAMEEQIADARDQGPRNIAHWFEQVAAARHSLAVLVGAPHDDDIALTRSTTHAILSLANALPWRPGDNVVITDLEFPANVYPWLSLAWREVETRVVAHRPDGRVAIDDLATAIDGRTRVLAVSWVAFANGFRHDLASLSQLCADRGVLLFTDIIQGAGALPLDLGALGVHMAAGASHKWIMGPTGSGYLYCRRDTVAEMIPAGVGWLGVEDPFDFNPDLRRLRGDARRFEEGGLSVASVHGTGAAVDLLLEVGIESIAANIERLTNHLLEEAESAGLEVASPRGPGEWSGIVVVKCNDPRAAVRALGEEHITAVPRGAGVRLAPHAYTRPDELDRAVAILRRLG